MNFGNIGFPELMLIAVVVLLLFGAKRLPEIGASMGRSIKEFKRGLEGMDKSIKESSRDQSQIAGEQRSDQVAAGSEKEEQPEPKRLMS
ncbi:MAG: Sec-independent protein translocase subunit TatA/TatB [Gemmatimonadaceae bacterium]